MMIGIVLDVMQKESAQMALDNGEGEEAELQSLRNDVRGLKAQLDRMESALSKAYSTAPTHPNDAGGKHSDKPTTD